jgi:hypothetical protein
LQVFLYAEAVLKFTKLNTVAQQREAVVQGRSLPPIPAPVYQSSFLNIATKNLNDRNASIGITHERPTNPTPELNNLPFLRFSIELIRQRFAKRRNRTQLLETSS